MTRAVIRHNENLRIFNFVVTDQCHISSSTLNVPDFCHKIAITSVEQDDSLEIRLLVKNCFLCLFVKHIFLEWLAAV